MVTERPRWYPPSKRTVGIRFTRATTPEEAAVTPTATPSGELEPIETASRDALTALQLERLRWSLRHAYDNVAHYRQKCVAAGVAPDDLKTLADLAKFPFTTKDDLRATYPFGMFAVPREQVLRIHASSGTTGQ